MEKGKQGRRAVQMIRALAEAGGMDCGFRRARAVATHDPHPGSTAARGSVSESRPPEQKKVD